MPTSSILCAIGLLGVISVSPAIAQPAASSAFGAPQTPTGVLPRGIEVADLDGDGLMDVVVAMEQSDYLDVSLGDGAGRFTLSARLLVADGPRALAIADFNDDGLLDVAVGHCRTPSVWILLGDGTGGFTRDPDRAAVVGDCVQAIVAVDVTSDGVPDVVVASASGVRILASDGAGGFLADPMPVLTDARFGLAAGDLDGDGDLDVVAAGPGNVRVLLNSGMGLTPSGVVVTRTGVDVALGDIDGDGLLDVATAEAENSVTVARGNGVGGFGRSDSIALGGRGVRVQIADLDGDGRAEVLAIAQPTAAGPGQLSVIGLERLRDRFVLTTQEVGRTPLGLRVARIDRDLTPDVVMTNGLACPTAVCAGPGEITVLLNRGLNGLGAYRTSPVGRPDPRAMASGDLNGDGVLDLVVAHGNENVVSVLVNDGLGNFRSLTIADLSLPTAVAIGDVDGDGHADVLVGDVWRVVLLRNRGDGSLAPPEFVATANRVRQLALVDMDGDGDLDVVLLNWNELKVLINAGDGTFAAGSDGILVSDGAEVLATGDVNGNGYPDVLVSAGGGLSAGSIEARVEVYSNLGGSLAWSTSRSTHDRLLALASADLDGDGRDEIVAATEGSVRIISLASEAPTHILPASRTITSLVLADVDLDGILDIIASEGRDSRAPSEGVTVWRGDGAGGFAPGEAYLAGYDSMAVAVGPMSLRDPRPGLAVLDAGRLNVWTLLQGFGAFGIDTDFDLLPDALEAILALDPLDMDSDDDGLPDGIDPDTLRAAVATIPQSALRNPGLRQALDAVLRSLEPLIWLRKAEPVQRTLATHYSRYDGCLTGKQPDQSDWVTDCDAQALLQTVNSTLAWNLALHFSNPPPTLARTINPHAAQGGSPPEQPSPPRGTPPRPGRDRGRDELPPLAGCGTAIELFAVLPTPARDLAALLPLGFTAPPRYTLPIPKVYPVSRVDPSKGTPELLPLLVASPAHLRAVAIVRTTDPQTGAVEYAVHLRPCLEVRVSIEHLQMLSPVLDLAAADIADSGTPLGEGVLVKAVDVALAAGELVGVSQPGGYGIDLIDERAADLPFANPDRYRVPESTLAALSPAQREAWALVAPQPLKQFCVVDYFAQPARAELEALFGRADGGERRTTPPLCGAHEQDDPGTARGNWFLPGSSALVGQDAGAIALVGDAVSPGQPIFSVSHAFGIDLPSNTWIWPAGEYLFTPSLAPGPRINEPFEDVWPGGVHCYDGLRRRSGEPVSGVVLVEVFASQGANVADRLRIERQQAVPSCAAAQGWAFTAGALVFER